MTPDVMIGVLCLVGVVACVLVLRRVRRVWVRRVVGVVALAGWSVGMQFLLKALVPTRVLAVVLLGGIVVAIGVAAVVGSRQNR
jgi:hypothetical protein